MADAKKKPDLKKFDGPFDAAAEMLGGAIAPPSIYLVVEGERKLFTARTVVGHATMALLESQLIDPETKRLTGKTLIDRDRSLLGAEGFGFDDEAIELMLKLPSPVFSSMITHFFVSQRRRKGEEAPETEQEPEQKE